MATTSAVLATLAIVAIISTVTTQEQIMPPSNITSNNQNVNFTQLFEQRIKEPMLFLVSDADVVYQSPKTVILHGDTLTIGSSGQGLVDNQYLSQGVDTVKEYGYKVDSVTTSGLSTSANPLRYTVIMSHP